MDKKEMERRSSAATLSDMEIFVFPELMYSLVLANILSPVIWKWLDDPWFADIRKMKPYRRIQRLKQFVMDHYVFNLDLETWGLTSQKRELERFAPFLSPDAVAQSNALFGYQGDAYYFDIDIRTHFGLDKYDADVIPYWKTETAEAMGAFRHQEGRTTGAGECVSLAALYAAALFIVAGIPLEDVFLLATPLHSQNFIDWEEGILVNNRRLVTKAMWFNGSLISGQARRALENERVTIVSHPSGWIHALYGEATIDPAAYGRFSGKLRAYLRTPLTPALFGSFLRQNAGFQRRFVLRRGRGAHAQYLPLEEAFLFESDCPYFVVGGTREKLLAAVPGRLFSGCGMGRAVLDDVEAFLAGRPVDPSDPAGAAALEGLLGDAAAGGLAARLGRFLRTEPRLPDPSSKRFARMEMPLAIRPGMTRGDILAHLEAVRGGNVMADMAFYAWRDMSRCDWRPFARAALERNPVCAAGAEGKGFDELAALLAAWPAESIYEEPFRLAQPDEVWNFRRGDGWEKALAAAAVLRARKDARPLTLRREGGDAVLAAAGGAALCRFPTAKRFPDMEWDLPPVMG